MLLLEAPNSGYIESASQIAYSGLVPNVEDIRLVNDHPRLVDVFSHHLKVARTVGRVEDAADDINREHPRAKFVAGTIVAFGAAGIGLGVSNRFRSSSHI